MKTARQNSRLPQWHIDLPAAPRITLPLFLALGLLAAAVLLTGCGLVSGGSRQVEGTVVPTPTRDPSGYQAIESQACLVNDWSAMQSDKAQGDLIAWQPGQHNLAYMAPSDRSSWYIGSLLLAKGPDFKETVSLAPNVLATGDLTWSPNGDLLAFLAYRPNENVYTVMTVRPDGSGLTDRFPTDTARTDSNASDKAIIGWKDDQTLQVITSCGEECRQAYNINIQADAEPALTPTKVANYRELVNNLQIHQYALTPTQEQFPRTMHSPAWAPDNDLIAFLDKRGFPWLLSRQRKTMYPLDIGLRDVDEIQWASDSANLAIRAEDRIFAFEVPCRQQQKP